MLTTTLEGLWILQVLAGIEVLAPELGLRPHLPSIETRDMALRHPLAEELRLAGVIDVEGNVDETVREWMTVLARRDVALLLQAHTPANQGQSDQVLVARLARWWVSLERSGIQLRLSGVGTATNAQSAARLLDDQIARLCGSMPAAAIKPATLDVADLLSKVRSTEELHAFLVNDYDVDQTATLSLAADRRRSAQASIVAIQAGVPHGPARSCIAPSVVTILDTPRGRLVSETVRRDGKAYMIVSPGTTGNIASAVIALMRELPANEQWYSHRKAV